MRHWDFSREVFAWRDETARPEITLRITLRVIEEVPAHRIPTVLDGLKVEARLRAHPQLYTIVKHGDSGIVVDQLDGPRPEPHTRRRGRMAS